MEMRTRNHSSTRASRIRTAAWVVSLLGIIFLPSLFSQTTNAPTTNTIDYTVKNDTIEFPLVLKFKGFRPSVLSTNDLKNDKLIYRTIYVTNKSAPGSNTSAATTGTNTVKKKKTKKRAPDEQAYLVGVSLYNKKLYGSAEDKFKEALTFAADGKFGDDANMYLARMRFESGDLTAALAALDSVKQKKSQANYYRAYFYASSTNDEKAIVAYETMKQQDDPDAWFFETAYAVRMPFLHKKMAGSLIGDLEKLLADRSVATAKDKLLLTLGELYEKDRDNRNLRKAVMYYEKLVKVYPNSPDAKQASARAAHINKNFLKIR